MKWDAFLQALAAVHPEPPVKDWSVHAHETGVDLLRDPERGTRSLDADATGPRARRGVAAANPCPA